MMISNWKNPFVSMVYTKIFQRRKVYFLADNFWVYAAHYVPSAMGNWGETRRPELIQIPKWVNFRVLPWLREVFTRTLPCKAKRQYLRTLQVSRYCLLALQSIRYVCKTSSHWYFHTYRLLIRWCQRFAWIIVCQTSTQMAKIVQIPWVHMSPSLLSGWMLKEI